MPDKNVLIMVASPPFIDLNYYEALRTAVGLWEHVVKILWRENGVYSVLKTADHTITKKFFDEFVDLDIKLFVDDEELQNRGINSEDLIEGIKPIRKEEIISLIDSVDVSLVF
jgi:sulfur relay (sulfurtransferase) DsrF/TusC family protein